MPGAMSTPTARSWSMWRRWASVPARSLVCPTCTRTLGTISRKRDHRGNPRDKLRLSDHAVKVERVLFRGRFAECRCGERVKLPDGMPVEFN